MRVSVAIPCYNSGAQLERTVASALSQTLPPLEILCVDDASTDDTWQRIRALELSSGGIVRGIRHERNHGVGSAGRNTAIRDSLGDWIALLDHDDEWAPNKLERQARLHEAFPAAELLHSDGLLQKDDATPSLVRYHDDHAVWDENPFPIIFLRNYIIASSTLMPRRLFDRVGFFTEDPNRAGANDIDMWLRLARRGVAFRRVDEPLCVRRLHPENMSRTLPFRGFGRRYILEEYLGNDPEAAALMGSSARSALIMLYLEAALRYLRQGETESARGELRRAWALGGGEVALWGLRGELALYGRHPKIGARLIRKIAIYFRARCDNEMKKFLGTRSPWTAKTE